ncbi:MAG: diacylglycerol kinase family protein [Clostridia bacterium]|nr:diacylglycerol kinase family protein [Clostridia bacterium]
MIYVLYNSLAGNKHSVQEADALRNFLGGELIKKDIQSIDYKAFLTSLTAEDTVVLCGGDGTLNHFANESDGLDLACEILYYPSGSGNDFAHDVGIEPHGKPVSIKQYLQNLPLVEVKGKNYRFLNNVGFGIDGYCCEVGDLCKTKSNKPVNYTAIAIKGLLFHYKPTNATVEIDGKTYTYEKVWLAPTMKGRYYGGGMIATPAQDRSASDGKLSVMIFHGSSKIRTLMIFPSIFKGEHVKHEKFVAIHTGYDVCVTFDRPTALQIDGETILGVTEYKATARVPAVIS